MVIRAAPTNESSSVEPVIRAKKWNTKVKTRKPYAYVARHEFAYTVQSSKHKMVCSSEQAGERTFAEDKIACHEDKVVRHNIVLTAKLASCWDRDFANDIP